MTTDPNLSAAVAASPLAKIMMATGHIGYYWDLKTDHIVWFGDWQKLFGATRTYPPHNAETFAAMVLPEDHYLVFGGGDGALDRSYRLRQPDGRIIWVREQGMTETEGAGPVRQCGMLSLVEAPGQRSYAQQKEWLERDPLTRRPNRSHMMGEIEKVLTGSREARDKTTYLVVGIDRMAYINEAVGAAAGDELLCNVGTRLSELVPTNVQVGRTGGDVFGLLIPSLSREEIGELSTKILDNFHNNPIPAGGTTLHTSVSIGAVMLSSEVSGSTEVMIHAEQALNDARLRGRNIMIEYRPSSQKSEERKQVIEMGERFKKALKENRLRLAYQPVIDAATGHVVFYEALIRMFRETGELIPAADFVPAVEQLGLALDLDHHVLDMIVRELEQYPDLRLAMNVSGITASNADWPEYLAAHLKDKPDVARRLIIEITETVAITDVDETKRFSEKLNELGGSVAIDDFGSGATSVQHLRSLSLSIMKIDRSMIIDMLGNEQQEHLVRMMIAIARGLGLKTVAEGVETEDVARWLQKEKVDMMQGYYFGKPSLERPWIALKGAELPETGLRALLGDKLFSNDTVQIHIGSFKAPPKT